jgi:hypothetical protein
MKHYVCYLVLILIIISCHDKNVDKKYLSIKTNVENISKQNDNEDNNKNTVIFRYKMLNLGTCKKDTIIDIFYYLINRSKKNVLIEKINGSCGCMTFNYKTSDIVPNEESVIKVRFITGSRGGFFKKLIFVYLKSERIITLYFNVRVV